MDLFNNAPIPHPQEYCIRFDLKNTLRVCKSFVTVSARHNNLFIVMQQDGQGMIELRLASEEFFFSDEVIKNSGHRTMVALGHNVRARH